MTPHALSETGFTIHAIPLLHGDFTVAKSTAETLGHRITRCRKERGLTQKELAEILNVSQPVVSDYENDVIRLPADMVVLLAHALNITADELLGLKLASKTNGALKNRRLSRRLQEIDKLPSRDQDALFRTIDAFLNKA